MRSPLKGGAHVPAQRLRFRPPTWRSSAPVRDVAGRGPDARSPRDGARAGRYAGAARVVAACAPSLAGQRLAARSGDGRGHFRCVSLSVAAGEPIRASRRSARAARRLREAREALRSRITLALLYPALVTAHCGCRRRGAARLCRAASSRFSRTPSDAALAYARADRGQRLLRARPKWAWLDGHRDRSSSVFALANRRLAFRARWHAGTAPHPGRSDKLVTTRSTPRALPARSRSSSAAARRCCARSMPRARRGVGVAAAAPRPAAAAELVREGVSLARALKEQRMVPPMLTRCVGQWRSERAARRQCFERAAGKLERKSETPASPGSRRCCSPR